MYRVPILKIGSVLLVSIQVDLDDQSVLQLQEDLTDRIVASAARGVLIDISGLEIVDSYLGRLLASMASISQVLDAQTVVVGMRPAVAITLVELGLTLSGVRTALDVDRGLALPARLGVQTMTGGPAGYASTAVAEDAGRRADPLGDRGEERR